MSTSRFCFYPDPIARRQGLWNVAGAGASQGGHRLRPQRAGVRAGVKGSLTQIMAGLQLYGEPVYKTDDELARTVIGVMTGFLPPADGCMRWALYDWIEEKTLPASPARSHRLAVRGCRSTAPTGRFGPGSNVRCRSGRRPIMLWRTATSEHRLGNVDVAADDRVFVGIVSALAEDAAAGITDVYPIFGGDRGAPDGPLHACPAYKAAMGTMLGIISVLLENFRIEPLPAPLLVRLEGRSPLMRQLIASPEVAAASAAVIEAGKRAAAKPAQSAILPGLPVPPPATKPPAAKPAAQRPAAKGGLKQPRILPSSAGSGTTRATGTGRLAFQSTRQRNSLAAVPIHAERGEGPPSLGEAREGASAVAGGEGEARLRIIR